MKQVIYKISSLFFSFFIVVLSFGQGIGSNKVTLDNNFNNKFDPAFNNLGNEFYFVSNTSGKFKLYFSKKNNLNKWSKALPVENINNFKNGLANIRYPSLNYDGSVLYFSADYSKDSSDIDIYYSVRKSGIWSLPISIGVPINSKGSEEQPSISADNKSLYFVRNNTTSEIENFACKSIFVSTKDREGNWLSPKKLPIPINVGCEHTPKIALDNKTLYFSSNREGGKGGFDIYKTRLIAKNVWLPAENVAVLNTEFNDFCPSIYFNSDNVYYSIEKNDNNIINCNIYENKMPRQFLPGKVLQLKGKITDLSTHQPIYADISIIDPFTSRQLFSLKNVKATGNYEFYLPKGNEYQMDFHKDKYSHYFFNINTEKLRQNIKQTKHVELYRNISLMLNVIDEEIYKPIESEIKVYDRDSVIVKTDIIKEKTGRYKIILPIGEKYRIDVGAKFYDLKFLDLDLTGIVQFDEFENDIELKSNKIEFNLNISDEVSVLGEPIEVIITNLETNEVTKTTVTPDSEGNYKIHLRDGDKYNVSVSPKGYSFYNTTVDLKKKRKGGQKKEKKIVVKLKKLKKDTKLTLKNITFEVNSADLNTLSFSELDRVEKLMNDNPKIKIEISAHTDNSGSNSLNLRLSKKRARSVLVYLLEKNIAKSRLISKGYGETKPKYPNDTDENKAKNRRVELKLLQTN